MSSPGGRKPRRIEPNAAKPPASPLQPQITGVILAFNEANRIRGAIECLQGWTCQIIVIDNCSTDDTAAIARELGALVISAPRAKNFDALRELAVEYATGDWLYFLDCDERVSPELAQLFTKILQDRGSEIASVQAPFKTYFCGKWMQHSTWWPGYTRPQLLKKGCFRYNKRLHAGVSVDGQVIVLPAEERYAIEHFSYGSLDEWIAKINSYTDAAAENLLEDGLDHSWQTCLADFMRGWQTYYTQGKAHLDGMHGFVLSFMSASYEFISRAKLWSMRYNSGAADDSEPVPGSVQEMLGFMSLAARDTAGTTNLLRSYARRSRAANMPASWLAPQVEAGRTPTMPANLNHKLTACILAHNEEDRIEDAIKSLLGWTDQIIVIDNASTDQTAAIARRYGALVISAPATDKFDALRNLAIEHAIGDWILYLDADERVPPALGPTLRRLINERGGEFEAVCLTFKNTYYGKWMQSPAWWPGYKGPQLFKKGTFRYGDVVHSGGLVDGRVMNFPADDASLAVVHLAYPDIFTYLTKINLYTRLEAGFMNEIGAPHSWQAMLAHFVHDWHVHYDDLRAGQDGMHGFVQAFMCSFYRFAARAKLWDQRRAVGAVDPAEPVPASLEEMLDFMARVLRDGAAPWLQRGRPAPESAAQHANALPPAPPTATGRATAILIQSAAGDQTSLLQLTRARHEAYANSHGMDFVCRFGPQQTERTAHWDKIVLILQALRAGKWEHVIWLDADTLIVDPSRDLRAALPPASWLGMVKHGNPPWYNCGAMYIRTTPQALAFFEEVWRTWPVGHGWEDNLAIIRVLGFDPDRWRGVTVIGDEWNSTRQMNVVENAVVRAWHGDGPAHVREGFMRQELQRIGAAAPAPAPHPQRLPSHTLQLDGPEPVNFLQALGRKLRVLWEGDFDVLSSLSNVNRELCLRLIASGDVELCIRLRPGPWSSGAIRSDPRFAELFACGRLLSGPPDITVRHSFPPDWSPVTEGKLVVIQPWEYSHLSERAWVEGATNNAHEVWANSRFVRDVFVRSGVQAEKIRLLPHGVRTDIFSPEGSLFPLATKKRTRFLFVGGAIPRKGADILLRAYLSAFTAADDVCLIVKSMGSRTFYQGQDVLDAFRAAQAQPGAPEIIIIEEDLTEEQLAALYRSCTAVTLPYRGEGFALSPFEGQSCGRIPIVTAGGATDEYVSDSFGLRVPARRVPVASMRNNPNLLPFPYTELEPDLGALIEALKWVHNHPEEAAQRGMAAREFILDGWTWDRPVGIVRERMRALVAPALPKAAAPPKLWAGMAGYKAKRRRSGKRPLISLCIIARDEGPRIRFAIESAEPYVDEIIVLDTGSVDNTRQIAAECGATVYEADWEDNFAESRNKSLRLARGLWIYWMDSDDVLSSECGSMLRQLALDHPNLDAAFQVQVRIPPGPNEFSPSVVDHIKLFPNRPDVFFEHRVHEQVLPSLRRAGIEIHFSDVYVTHAHYDRSPEGQAKKRRRDFRLLELDLMDNPEHPFTLFNLGMTFLYASREYEVAAQFLNRSIQRSHWKDSIVRKAYALLTMARVCQQDWPAALAAIEAGRQHYPDDAELLFHGGQVYQNLGRTTEARECLERLINGGEGPHYRSVDVGLRTYRGRHELALLHRRAGDVAQCESILKAVIDEYPAYLPARQDLAATWAAHGRAGEARALMGVPEPVQEAVAEGAQAEATGEPESPVGLPNPSAIKRHGRRAAPRISNAPVAASAAPESTPLCDIHLAIMTVKRDGDYIHHTIKTMAADQRVDVRVGSPDADYLRPYRSAPHIHLSVPSGDEWDPIESKPLGQRACWNYWRCLGTEIDSAKGLVIIEDDVEFATGWQRRLARTIRALEAVHGDSFLLALYCAYGFVSDPYLKGELYARYPLDIFAGTQGVYFPARVRDGFRPHLKEHGVDSFRLNYDMILREYLEQNNIPAFVTAPSLVQHKGFVTTGLCENRHYSPVFFPVVE